MKKYNNEILKKLLILAFPSIIQEICMVSFQLVDTAMVGYLGAVAIAAVSINTAPIWLINGIGSACAIGSSALTARSVGAKDQAATDSLSTNSLFLCGVLGLVVSVIFIFFGYHISYLMGADEEVLPYAALYLQIVGSVFIFKYLALILSAFFRCIGKFKIPMYINLFSGVLNIVVNYLLIFPTRNIQVLGIEILMYGADLGVVGAAIGTAFSSFFSCMVLWILIKKNHSFHFKAKYIQIKNIILKKILPLSAPVFMENIITTTGQMVFLRLVATFGTVIIAANSLALSIEAVSYSIAYGLSSTASAVIGNILGQGDSKKALKYSYIFFVFGVVYMCLCGLTFITVPEIYLSLFTNSDKVINSGKVLVMLLSVMQPFFASTIILGGIMKGAGDSKYVMSVAMLCKGVVRITTSLLFVVILDGGIIGAWLSMILDQCIQGLLLFRRFRSKKWIVTGVIK